MACPRCGWAGSDGSDRHVEDGPLEGFSEEDIPEELWCAPPAARVAGRLRRGDRPRARTLAPRRLSREERAEGADLTVPEDAVRPRTRGDCAEGPRPCPWISCPHHLAAEVSAAGGLKLNFPHLEVWEMKETCSLDVADRGGATLDEVGGLLNVTRERARQIEVKALLKIRLAGQHLGQHLD